MFDHERFIQKLANVQVGNHGMTCEEWFAISQTGNSSFDVSVHAFRFGFLKGQRAEKAAQKKKRSANT